MEFIVEQDQRRVKIVFFLQTAWLKNVVQKEGVWLLDQASTTNELNAFGEMSLMEFLPFIKS